MCCLWDSRISRTCCNVWSFILPWGSEEDNGAGKDRRRWWSPRNYWSEKKEFKRIMGARPTECLVSYWQTWPTGDTCWLLIDYCCWLLLLQIIFTFGKVHRSNCPTADWHQQETASKVNTFWRSAFPNPSQKGTLLQNIFWIIWSTFSLRHDWKISVLSCHHHALEGKNNLVYYRLCWNFWQH